MHRTALPPRTTQSYLAQTLPKLRSPENRTRFLCPKSISPLCKRHYLLSLTICPDTKPKSLPWFVPFPHSFFSHKFYLWLLGKDVTFLLVGRSSFGKVWVFNKAVNRPSILFFESKRTLNLLYKTSRYLLPNSPVLATEPYCCLTTT